MRTRHDCAPAVRRTGVLLLSLSFALAGCEPGDEIEPPANGGDCPELQEIAPAASGDVTGVTGCRTVSSDLVVDGHLVLLPGATLRVGEGVKLRVEIDLRAEGLPHEPVLITADGGADHPWAGIEVVGNAVVDLTHTTVEHGGLTDRGALWGVGDVALRNVTIRGSAGYGVRLDYGSSLWAFEANTFENNAQGGLSLDANVCGALDAASSYGGAVAVEGTVEDPATWTGAASYAIASFVDVQADLTLEAGAELVFGDDAAFDVADGVTFQVLGTAEAPVVMTADEPTRGRWRGLSLGGNPPAPHRLSHAVVEYGGNGNAFAPANIHARQESSLEIEHTASRESAGWGLFLDEYLLGVQSTANTFTGNRLGPVKAAADAVGHLDAESSYTGNDLDTVEVITTLVDSDLTWRNLGDVAYYVPGWVEFEAHLTVEPGVVVLFGEGASLTFSDMNLQEPGGTGRLTAVGTVEDPIVFSAEVTEPGSWMGLSFYDAHLENRLEHVSILYAGGDAEAVIETHTTDAQYPTVVTIANSTIGNFVGCAIDYDYGDSHVTATDVTFDGAGGEACYTP